MSYLPLYMRIVSAILETSHEYSCCCWQQRCVWLVAVPDGGADYEIPPKAIARRFIAHCTCSSCLGLFRRGHLSEWYNSDRWFELAWCQSPTPKSVTRSMQRCADVCLIQRWDEVADDANASWERALLWLRTKRQPKITPMIRMVYGFDKIYMSQTERNPRAEL